LLLTYLLTAIKGWILISIAHALIMSRLRRYALPAWARFLAYSNRIESLLKRLKRCGCL